MIETVSKNIRVYADNISGIAKQMQLIADKDKVVNNDLLKNCVISSLEEAIETAKSQNDLNFLMDLNDALTRKNQEIELHLNRNEIIKIFNPQV